MDFAQARKNNAQGARSWDSHKNGSKDWMHWLTAPPATGDLDFVTDWYLWLDPVDSMTGLCARKFGLSNVNVSGKDLPGKLPSTVDLLQTVCYSRALLFVQLNFRVSQQCKNFENICKKMLTQRTQWLNLHTSTQRKQHSEATAQASPTAGFNNTENIRLAADAFNQRQL